MRTGSILADDPSCFRHWSQMELMDHDEYIKKDVHSRPSRTDLVHSRSRITASKFGRSSVPMRALAHSSMPNCRAAVVGARFDFVGIQLL